MPEVLARALYSLLLRLATPVLLGRCLWRSLQEPLYRAHLAERWGWGPAQPAGALWVHAVSLGETLAARPLVQALREQRPGLRLLLTHGTATGREAGQALLGPGDHQAWLPVDTPGAMRRFLRRFQPAAGVLVDTEIWPNLLAECQRAGVPVVAANARLSERSAQRGQRLAALMHPAVARLSRVLAQTEADARRFVQAGAPQVEVCGNLKFDIRPDPALLAQGRAWRAQLQRPVLMLAVSREGEEAMLLKVWLARTTHTTGMRPDQRPPLLLLVPRHPQRFENVAQELLVGGLRLVRRSALAPASGFDDETLAADVWLGDSMREMPLYYGLADVALLGGSFAPLGGQNLLEAAACGCPVVMGPHTFNFAAAAELALAAGAARRAADMAAAVDEAMAWLDNTASLRQASQAAQELARPHAGASARMASAVLQCLAPPGAATSGNTS
jgi:3-deoxy-D-manno-octulosonic-acid transferase